MNNEGKALFKIEFADGSIKEYKERCYVFALAKAVSDKVDEENCKFEDITMESLLFLNNKQQWEYIIKKDRFTIGIH